MQIRVTEDVGIQTYNDVMIGLFSRMYTNHFGKPMCILIPPSISNTFQIQIVRANILLGINRNNDSLPPQSDLRWRRISKSSKLIYTFRRHGVFLLGTSAYRKPWAELIGSLLRIVFFWFHEYFIKHWIFVIADINSSWQSAFWLKFVTMIYRARWDRRTRVNSELDKRDAAW